MLLDKPFTEKGLVLKTTCGSVKLSYMLGQVRGPSIIPTRSMSASTEVLEQAREALAVHRAWMTKRRVRNAVAPAANFEGETPMEDSQFRPTTWAHGASSLSTPKNGIPPSPITLCCCLKEFLFHWLKQPHPLMMERLLEMFL